MIVPGQSRPVLDSPGQSGPVRALSIFVIMGKPCKHTLILIWCIILLCIPYTP